MLENLDVKRLPPGNLVSRVRVFTALVVLMVMLQTGSIVFADVIVFSETRQFAFSKFTSDVIVNSETDGAIDSAAASGATASSPATPVARTAARSSFTDISANAFFDDEFSFSSAGNLGFSTARFEGDVINLSSERREIFLEFFMPPSLMEYSTNLEFPFEGISGNLFVTLEVDGTNVFDFDARTHGDFFTPLADVFVNLSAESPEPGVDVSGLLAPTVSEVFSAGDFIRTVTVEFPALVGVVSLGEADPFDVLSFEYEMHAAVNGRSAGTTGIVAINDPPVLRDFFSLSSLPVEGDPPIVPEPSSVALFALGAVGLVVMERRRKRK